MLAAATALPYFTLPSFGGFQAYGYLVLAAIVVGAAAMVLAARARGIGEGDAILLATMLAIVGFIGAHVFDVALYQYEYAAENPALWFHILQGVSMFGALIVMAVLVPAWSWGRRLDLAKVADSVALGGLVALVIGRIGCALVHDHAGMPTSLPIGVDFPRTALGWMDLPPDVTTLRLHDLGLEELLAVIPLAATMWLLARRLRPGMTATLAALIYAPIRFGLDFLRFPDFDPVYARLTAAQWGCLVMVACAISALVRLRRVGRDAID